MTLDTLYEKIMQGELGVLRGMRMISLGKVTLWDTEEFPDRPAFVATHQDFVEMLDR